MTQADSHSPQAIRAGNSPTMPALHPANAGSMQSATPAHAGAPSEAESLAALGDGQVMRLNAEHVALYEAMPMLGPVTVRTENHAVRIEKIGRFEKMGRDGTVGLTLGSSIDLRIFYAKWAYAFAVRGTGEQTPARGFHFFDAQGRAITRVLLDAESDHAAFDTLCARHAATQADIPLVTDAADTPVSDTPDDAVDRQAFRASWDAMTDPHQFFGLLRRFSISRIQAMRLARADQAYRLQDGSCQNLLQDVVNTSLPIMAFVGNHGQIQIHTGPIHTVNALGAWLTAGSPDLSLTLCTDLIDSIWVVRKPTSDGIVTSVELYDTAGENIAMFFGARKPGQAERADWRAAVARRTVHSGTPAPLIPSGDLSS